MSQSKALGPAAGVAATLPVTGFNTVAMVVVGLVILVAGMLLMRATRTRRNKA